MSQDRSKTVIELISRFVERLPVKERIEKLVSFLSLSDIGKMATKIPKESGFLSYKEALIKVFDPGSSGFENDEINEQFIRDKLKELIDEELKHLSARLVEQGRTEIILERPDSTAKINEKGVESQPSFPSSVIKPHAYGYYLIAVITALFVAILLTAVAVQYSTNPSTTVNIEFNIAELIAAVLAGGGIAAAGVAYAIKALGFGSSEN